MHEARPDGGLSRIQQLGQRSIITHFNGLAEAGTRPQRQQAEHVADWERLFRFRTCYFSLTKHLQDKGDTGRKKQFGMIDSRLGRVDGYNFYSVFTEMYKSIKF